MIGVITFNVLLVLLGVWVASPAVPAQRLSDALGWLHTIIGISTPRPDKVRMVVLIWIGTVIVLVDGLLALLLFLVSVVR